MKLTQAFVRRCVCEKEKVKQFFYDDEIKVFILEVRNNGRKTYYQRTTSADKIRKTIKIADATIVNINDARIKAIKIKKAIEDGKDVVVMDNSNNKSKLKKTIPTLNHFFENEYLPYVKAYSKSWDKNQSIFIHHILPSLGNIPMDKITSAMVFKCHSEVKSVKNLSNAMANKVIIY